MASKLKSICHPFITIATMCAMIRTATPRSYGMQSGGNHSCINLHPIHNLNNLNEKSALSLTLVINLSPKDRCCTLGGVASQSLIICWRLPQDIWGNNFCFITLPVILPGTFGAHLGCSLCCIKLPPLPSIVWTFCAEIYNYFIFHRPDANASKKPWMASNINRYSAVPFN